MSSDLPKLKRPLRKVVKNFYQALKINTDLSTDLLVLDRGAKGGHGPTLNIGIWNIFKGNGGVKFFRDFTSIVHSCDLWLLQEVLASPHGLRDYVPETFKGIHGASYERMDGLREGVMNLGHLKNLDQKNQVIRFSKSEPLVLSLIHISEPTRRS